MINFETAEILFCKSSLPKYKRVKVPFLSRLRLGEFNGSDDARRYMVTPGTGEVSVCGFVGSFGEMRRYMVRPGTGEVSVCGFVESFRGL